MAKPPTLILSPSPNLNVRNHDNIEVRHTMQTVFLRSWALFFFCSSHNRKVLEIMETAVGLTTAVATTTTPGASHSGGGKKNAFGAAPLDHGEGGTPGERSVCAGFGV